MPFETAVERLKTKLGGETISTSEFRDNRRVHVAAEQVFDALETLKEDCGFDMLVDVTAADYLKYPAASDRFGVVYALLNTETGERIYVRTFLNEPDVTLPSAFSLWKGADWMEREVYDMYGILFEDHPNLTRILMPEEFTSFPLRKDYPMRGRGERHNFPVLTRSES